MILGHSFKNICHKKLKGNILEISSMSVESQKGANAAEQCSIVNQKDANAVQSLAI